MKPEMIVPNFNYGYCDNCHQPIQSDSADFNHYINLEEMHIKVTRTFCEDCIGEVIQYRHLIRNVAEMTSEIVHRHNAEIYNRVYDNVNFKNK